MSGGVRTPCTLPLDPPLKFSIQIFIFLYSFIHCTILQRPRQKTIICTYLVCDKNKVVPFLLASYPKMSLKNRRFDLKNAPRKRRSQSYPYWQAYNYWLNNSFLQKQCCFVFVFAVFLAFFLACSWRSDHEQGADTKKIDEGKIERFFPSCSFWVHRVRSNPTTWTPGAGYILFPY